MCQVFYSVNSHRKVVHLQNCTILRRIPKENRRSFSSIEEARAHGYHLCSCCAPIAQKYRKERKKIKEFCRMNDLTCKLQDGALHVISRHDCWRIIVNGHNKNIFLYHKNTDRRERNNPYHNFVPGYHSQPSHSSTILGYLEYIVAHDQYRDQHPCTEKVINISDKNVIKDTGKSYPGYRRIKGTKRYRKEQARKKRQARRAAIIRVYALLDELAAIGY